MSGNDKDPWGRERQSPPDLDDVVNKFLGSLGGILGSKKSGNGSTPRKKGSPTLIFIILIVWLASGFYIISENERGVVLRFGEHVELLCLDQGGTCLPQLKQLKKLMLPE